MYERAQAQVWKKMRLLLFNYIVRLLTRGLIFCSSPSLSLTSVLLMRPVCT